MNKKLNKKGFTIVELVIVIAVIAILAAVLIPTFVSLTKKANLSADQQAVRQMNTILKAESASGEAPKSLADVHKLFAENNLVPEDYKPLTKNHVFYWDSENNTILLWSAEDSKVVYPEKDYKGITAVKSGWIPFTSATLIHVVESLANGGTITITESINAKCENNIPAGMIFSGGEATTIDFGDNKYTYDVTYTTGINGAGFSAIYACDGANITVKNANIESTGYGIYLNNNATVTIESGKFVGQGASAVQVGAGTLYIKGGTFIGSDDAVYVINCLDANWKDGSAKVVITGGTFVNFNPADNKAEGAGTNFVADGYKVVSETQSNGDVWYTVVAE